MKIIDYISLGFQLEFMHEGSLSVWNTNECLDPQFQINQNKLILKQKMCGMISTSNTQINKQL